jgi:hypothetical protein
VCAALSLAYLFPFPSPLVSGGGGSYKQEFIGSETPDPITFYLAFFVAKSKTSRLVLSVAGIDNLFAVNIPKSPQQKDGGQEGGYTYGLQTWFTFRS